MRFDATVMFRLSLYFYTLRFLRRNQLLYYLRFLLLYRLYKIFGSRIENLLEHFIPSNIGVRNIAFLSLKKLVLLGNESSEEICRSAESISKRQFLFLNFEREYRDKIVWNDRETSKLWRYKLHYFDYILHLAKAYFYTRDERFYLSFKGVVEEWIKANPFGQGDGWEPYTISLRIVNWIKAYVLFERLIKQDSEFQNLLLNKLYLKTLFLEKNLEFHLCANHLLKNIKALIFFGVFFESEDADKWIEKGLRMLQQELEEQILSDGGHFERSPMYHKIVLQDLFEIHVLLRDYGTGQDLSWLEQKISSMYLFLEVILHPDGEVPLFNDSTLDEAPKASILSLIYEEFFQKSEPVREENLTIKELRESGYFVIQDNEGSKAIIDCGKIGPDYLPAHAHCDTLSYELSLNGKRFIVDTGVYEYAVGEKRSYARSTKAHNTVVINGRDQSEIWSSFRVAQRAYPIYGNLERVNGLGYFEGAHDGYRKMNIVHRRKTWFGGAKIWVVLDEIEGRGEINNLESFIHFHPAVKWNFRGGEIYVEFESEEFRLVIIGEPAVDLIKTYYFPEFGKEEERFSVRLLTQEAHLPYRFGYAIIPSFKGSAYLEGEKIIVEINNSERMILG